MPFQNKKYSYGLNGFVNQSNKTHSDFIVAVLMEIQNLWNVSMIIIKGFFSRFRNMKKIGEKVSKEAKNSCTKKKHVNACFF